MRLKYIFFLWLITLSTLTHTLVTVLSVTMLGAIIGGAAGYSIHDKLHYASKQNCKWAFDNFNRLVNVPNPFDQAAKEKSVDPLIPLFCTDANKRYKNESPLTIADLTNDIVTQANDRMALLFEEIEDLRRYSHFNSYQMPNLQALEGSHRSFYGTPDDGIFSNEHLKRAQAEILTVLHKNVQDALKKNEQKDTSIPLHEQLKDLEHHIGLYEKFVTYNNCMTPKDKNLIDKGLHALKSIKDTPEFQLQLKVQYLKSYVLTLECRISQLLHKVSSLEDEIRRLRSKG